MAEEQIAVFASFDLRDWPTGADILRRAGHGGIADAPWNEDGCVVRFRADAPELPGFIRELRDRKIAFQPKAEHRCTPDELAGFDMFRIMPAKAKNAFGGPYNGTEFDMSSCCPKCGCAARRTSQMIVDLVELREVRDVVQLESGELLISRQIREAIERAGLSGCSIEPVRGWQTPDKDLDIFLLTPTNELPPFSQDSVVLKMGQCKVCRRDGHYDFPKGMTAELHYRKEDLTGRQVLDFNRTWEHFGRSKIRPSHRTSLFTQPIPVIGRKAMHVFSSGPGFPVRIEPVRLD
jgi:hypothetical protein